MMRMSRAYALLATLALTGTLLVPAAFGQGELDYNQYRSLAWAAERMDHLCQFEPIHGEPGMFFAIAERFGTVQVA